MGVPPGNRRVMVPRRTSAERYVAGGACPERSRRNTRGRQEGRPYPWAQQVIHEISGFLGGSIDASTYALYFAFFTRPVENAPNAVVRQACYLL